MSLNSTLRIDDAEREHVVAALGQHLGLGHLTMHEFESRLDTVYAATTRRELNTALADLPTTAQPPPLPRPPERRPSGMTKATALRALAPWALTAIVCLVIWVATSSAQGQLLYFWPIWVIGPWGTVLLAHAAIARTRPPNAAARVRRAAPR